MVLPKDIHFETMAIHGGQEPDTATGSVAAPIYQTTAYAFQSAAHAADLFSLREEGNIYTRLQNPTNAMFEERMAKLEGGSGALAFSSGHAAVAGTILNLARAGDEIVSASNLYGGTLNLFTYTLPKLGITTRFVDSAKPENFAAAITPRTKALYAEAVGNPKADVLDIGPVAKLAHTHGLPLIVDATFATPYLCRPLEFGANIVLHSATKFIGGHGTSMAGVVVDGGNFDWSGPRFSNLSEDDASYHGLNYARDCGRTAFITRLRVQVMRDFGACLSPFNAFMMLNGLETLHVRMERHVENAQRIAEFLSEHPSVKWVSYPGLASHPDHAKAQKYLPKGAGAVFTFGIRGGLEAGRRFIDALRIFSLVANVGDTRSLVIHPASTTHSQLGEAQLLAAGVEPDLIRLSVGLENAADLIADLDQALKRSQNGSETKTSFC